MNVFNIERAFRHQKERGWEKTFWCIDVHDTICKSTYERGHIDRSFYPDARAVLQWLNATEDICVILFTCSHRDDIQSILNWLEEHEIHFDYVNENPEQPSNELSNFEQKMYFNVLLEDKAGFEGETDWTLIKSELIKLKRWSDRHDR